jgi:hypothetical protein
MDFEIEERDILKILFKKESPEQKSSPFLLVQEKHLNWPSKDRIRLKDKQYSVPFS